MKEGSQTPWGKADHVRRIADGIEFAATPSHGGFHLSRQRQAEMPEALRLEEPWYEEDCEWSLVVLAFPDCFSRREIEAAHDSAKMWYPDRYEKHFDCTIPIEQSFIKSEHHFNAVHRNDWVVIAAWGSWQENVPDGQIGVVATRGGRRGNGRRPSPEERYFLVPENEYGTSGGPHGFVIDPSRHGPWCGPKGRKEVAA